jgi:cobalamin biosynthesis protein CobC
MRHGGNLHDAKALFPEAPEPWIDLSTGIDPNPYPVRMPDLSAFTRLPSGQSVSEVEAVAAQAYGVSDPAHVAAAPGSQALIRLLPHLRPKGKVAIVGPTYSEHERSWSREGHEVAMVASLSNALAIAPDAIVIVNPNNPDGRIAAPPDLAAAASALHPRGGWLVVDEAFADLEDGVSMATQNTPGAIILRSFGKAYGLAGVRLGFAVASPALNARIKEELGPWAVSGPALAIGTAALADQAWLSQQRTRLLQSAQALDALLVEAGFTLAGGTRLFRLAWRKDAQDWFDRLARAGIWIRKFSQDVEMLRFGIPPEDGWARLAQALKPRQKSSLQ